MLEFNEQNQQPPKSPQRRRKSQKNDLFDSKTISKGFFSHNINQVEFQQQTSKASSNINITSAEKIDTARRHKRQKSNFKLQSLNEIQDKVEFYNFINKPQSQKLQSSTEHLKKEINKPQIQRTNKETNFCEIKTQKYKDSLNKKSEIIQKAKKLVLHNQDALIFQDSEQSNDNQQHQNQRQYSDHQQLRSQYIHKQQNKQNKQTKQNKQIQQNNQSNQNDIKVQNSRQKSNSLTKFSLYNLKKVLSNPVRSNSIMRTTILRKDNGFFNIWPQFHVLMDTDQNFIMSGKKVSKIPYSTFVMTTNANNYTENSQFYLGKAKSSIMGQQLSMFGPGLSRVQALQKKQVPRQLLATVIYQTHYLSGGQPRDFRVFLLNPSIDYNSFSQVQLSSQQIPLHILYQNAQNKSKITKLKNRKPQYQQNINGYTLNFKGRVTIASVKNFILIQQGNDQTDVLIFGKFGNDKFHMDLVHPLTPMIALGIVLSSFDSKFFCQ